MTPLRVVAEMAEAVGLPGGPLALDGLLAARVATASGLTCASEDEVVEIDIPVAKSPCGRFHLASFSVAGDPLATELRYTNRRFPIERAQEMADAKLRTVQVTAGPAKSYRIPASYEHFERLEWWCIGDADAIRALLAGVTHLGKRRAVGRGRIASWSVEPCEPWGDGFPVVRDGMPLRTLPLDWPGVREDAARGFACITYPYWMLSREAEAWVAAR